MRTLRLLRRRRALLNCAPISQTTWLTVPCALRYRVKTAR